MTTFDTVVCAITLILVATVLGGKLHDWLTKMQHYPTPARPGRHARDVPTLAQGRGDGDVMEPLPRIVAARRELLAMAQERYEREKPLVAKEAMSLDALQDLRKDVLQAEIDLAEAELRMSTADSLLPLSIR